MHHEWFYDRPLFFAYQLLSKSLPCIELGDLPTPISQLTSLESFFHNRIRLYQKNDGLTGKIENGIRSFGGNKIRKLEFLLADALAHEAQSIMTYGCIGSNHVVATAVSSKNWVCAVLRNFRHKMLHR
jgi:1-aminocyclopropane-1-carboxylate deaminase/D-cysteine desulfhydrase-like pyridoxal-dependent ACC family enzyme